MRKLLLVALFFSFGIVITGCPISLDEKPADVAGFAICNNEEMCGDGYLCVQGRCQAKEEVQKSEEDGTDIKDVWCKENSDCLVPAQQVCDEGICRYECNSAGTTCPAHYFCHTDGLCYASTGGNTEDAETPDIETQDNGTSPDGSGDNDTGNDGSTEECAKECALANAYSQCRNGECVITRCTNGYRDKNGIAEDGCEYKCKGSDISDETCDGIDNDCDGMVDNVDPRPTTIEHCGRCFNQCTPATNAEPACVDFSCTIICHDGFKDENEDPSDGCETGSCKPTGDEICDDKDNNCDGNIDEGDLCPSGQSCVQGKCQQKCQDKCSPDGAKGCNSSNEVVTCSDSNSDGCLEFHVTETCGNGTTCEDGACVSGCSDDCVANGQTRCNGNNVETCGNYDSDLCLEWGNSTPCPSSQSCDQGKCGSSCSDECPANGTVKCLDDVVYACGNNDADSCLEWTIQDDCTQKDKVCTDKKTECYSGCADGSTEGYSNDRQMFACAGAWAVSGIFATSPGCNRQAGNTGTNQTGTGCNVQDLCAAGYHICKDKSDVQKHGSCSLNGMENGFFVTQQRSASTGTGNYTCKCEPSPTSPNNFFGCGDIGRSPEDSSCDPLNQVSANACEGDFALQGWSCPDGTKEGEIVTHTGNIGGVLCCID